MDVEDVFSVNKNSSYSIDFDDHGIENENEVKSSAKLNCNRIIKKIITFFPFVEAKKQLVINEMNKEIKSNNEKMEKTFKNRQNALPILKHKLNSDWIKVKDNTTFNEAILEIVSSNTNFSQKSLYLLFQKAKEILSPDSRDQVILEALTSVSSEHADLVLNLLYLEYFTEHKYTNVNETTKSRLTSVFQNDCMTWYTDLENGLIVEDKKYPLYKIFSDSIAVCTNRHQFVFSYSNNLIQSSRKTKPLRISQWRFEDFDLDRYPISSIGVIQNCIYILQTIGSNDLQLSYYVEKNQILSENVQSLKCNYHFDFEVISTIFIEHAFHIYLSSNQVMKIKIEKGVIHQPTLTHPIIYQPTQPITIPPREKKKPEMKITSYFLSDALYISDTLRAIQSHWPTLIPECHPKNTQAFQAVLYAEEIITMSTFRIEHALFDCKLPAKNRICFGLTEDPVTTIRIANRIIENSFTNKLPTNLLIYITTAMLRLSAINAHVMLLSDKEAPLVIKKLQKILLSVSRNLKHPAIADSIQMFLLVVFKGFYKRPKFISEIIDRIRAPTLEKDSPFWKYQYPPLLLIVTRETMDSINPKEKRKFMENTIKLMPLLKDVDKPLIPFVECYLDYLKELINDNKKGSALYLMRLFLVYITPFENSPQLSLFILKKLSQISEDFIQLIKTKDVKDNDLIFAKNDKFIISQREYNRKFVIYHNDNDPDMVIRINTQDIKPVFISNEQFYSYETHNKIIPDVDVIKTKDGITVNHSNFPIILSSCDSGGTYGFTVSAQEKKLEKIVEIDPIPMTVAYLGYIIGKLFRQCLKSIPVTLEEELGRPLHGEQIEAAQMDEIEAKKLLNKVYPRLLSKTKNEKRIQTLFVVASSLSRTFAVDENSAHEMSRISKAVQRIDSKIAWAKQHADETKDSLVINPEEYMDEIRKKALWISNVKNNISEIEDVYKFLVSRTTLSQFQKAETRKELRSRIRVESIRFVQILTKALLPGAARCIFDGVDYSYANKEEREALMRLRETLINVGMERDDVLLALEGYKIDSGFDPRLAEVLSNFDIFPPQVKENPVIVRPKILETATEDNSTLTVYEIRDAIKRSNELKITSEIFMELLSVIGKQITNPNPSRQFIAPELVALLRKIISKHITNEIRDSISTVIRESKFESDEMIGLFNVLGQPIFTGDCTGFSVRQCGDKVEHGSLAPDESIDAIPTVMVAPPKFVFNEAENMKLASFLKGCIVRLTRSTMVSMSLSFATTSFFAMLPIVLQMKENAKYFLSKMLHISLMTIPMSFRIGKRINEMNSAATNFNEMQGIDSDEGIRFIPLRGAIEGTNDDNCIESMADDLCVFVAPKRVRRGEEITINFEIEGDEIDGMFGFVDRSTPLRFVGVDMMGHTMSAFFLQQELEFVSITPARRFCIRTDEHNVIYEALSINQATSWSIPISGYLTAFYPAIITHYKSLRVRYKFSKCPSIYNTEVNLPLFHKKRVLKPRDFVYTTMRAVAQSPQPNLPSFFVGQRVYVPEMKANGTVLSNDGRALSVAVSHPNGHPTLFQGDERECVPIPDSIGRILARAGKITGLFCEEQKYGEVRCQRRACYRLCGGFARYAVMALLEHQPRLPPVFLKVAIAGAFPYGESTIESFSSCVPGVSCHYRQIVENAVLANRDNLQWDFYFAFKDTVHDGTDLFKHNADCSFGMFCRAILGRSDFDAQYAMVTGFRPLLSWAFYKVDPWCPDIAAEAASIFIALYNIIGDPAIKCLKNVLLDRNERLTDIRTASLVLNFLSGIPITLFSTESLLEIAKLAPKVSRIDWAAFAALAADLGIGRMINNNMDYSGFVIPMLADNSKEFFDCGVSLAAQPYVYKIQQGIDEELAPQKLKAPPSTYSAFIEDVGIQSNRKLMIDIEPDSEVSWFTQLEAQLEDGDLEWMRSPGVPFRVNLVGSGAIDAGGPMREACSNIAMELMGEREGVFEAISSEKFQCIPRRCSSKREEHRLRVAGAFIAAAMLMEQPLRISLAKAVWRVIARAPLNADYLFEIDGSLRERCEKTLSEKDKPSCDNLIIKGIQEIEERCRPLAEGFRVVYPIFFGDIVAPGGIEAMCSSTKRIQVEDVKDFVQFVDGNSAEFNSMFFAAIEDFSENELRMLIKFATGADTLPMVKERKLKVVQDESMEFNEALPSASTCLRVIRMPKYDNVIVMKSKLRLSISSVFITDDFEEF